MNEKIQQIAEQAGFYVSLFDPYNKQNQAIEKFAELLISHYEPKPTHSKWITEYPGEVFVVFDPTTDGTHILGAARTFAEAEKILKSVV